MTGTVFLLGHVRAADSVNQFLADLCRAFTDLGRRSQFILVDDGVAPLGEADLHAPGSFVIDINGKMDTGNFPKLALVVDHPLNHLHLSEPGRRTVLGVIDQGHCELSAYLGAPTAFIPHGGPEIDAEAFDAERDIDVLFVGNIPERCVASDHWEEIALKMGEVASHASLDPFVLLIEALGSACEGLSRSKLKLLLDMATNESQRLSRVAAITSVKDCVFHVVGHLPKEVEMQMSPKSILHGFNASFVQSWALMRRSKIVINISQKFPHGSHERIWYAMASGSAVVTNRSRFVEQDFTHGRDILFYDDPCQVGELVNHALVGRGDRGLAAAARPIYEAGHTWTDRAERILVAIIGHV